LTDEPVGRGTRALHAAVHGAAVEGAEMLARRCGLRRKKVAVEAWEGDGSEELPEEKKGSR